MLDLIYEQLQQALGGKKKLLLKVNDNRTTMLSVKWEPDCARVSLHRMFLQAPKNIMDELACFISKKPGPIPQPIRQYIDETLPSLDYSHTLDPNKLFTKGKTFDLSQLYDEVCDEQFGKRLPLQVTWFGNVTKRAMRKKITLGLYHDQLQLIKVHWRLDNKKVPDYVVKYVIYHEILHYLCPTYYDEKGHHHVHTQEFKDMEERYPHYESAQGWIRDNESLLFTT